MRRIVTTGIAVTLGASTALATGAFAGGNGAQRAALGAGSGSMSQCNNSTAGGNGFAIINGPGQPGAFRFVNGEVHLVGGAPNAQYTLGIARNNGDACQPAGTLKTNQQGIGNGHIDAATLGPGQYFVALFQGNTEEFASDYVSIN